MEYHLFAKHELCLELLCSSQCDAVGLDYYEAALPHFSGNFWWCTAGHYKRLHRIDATSAEFAHRYVMSETYVLGGHFKGLETKAYQLRHSGRDLSACRILPFEYATN